MMRTKEEATIIEGKEENDDQKERKMRTLMGWKYVLHTIRNIILTTM